MDVGEPGRTGLADGLLAAGEAEGVYGQLAAVCAAELDGDLVGREGANRREQMSARSPHTAHTDRGGLANLMSSLCDSEIGAAAMSTTRQRRDSHSSSPHVLYSFRRTLPGSEPISREGQNQRSGESTEGQKKVAVAHFAWWFRQGKSIGGRLF